MMTNTALLDSSVGLPMESLRKRRSTAKGASLPSAETLELIARFKALYQNLAATQSACREPEGSPQLSIYDVYSHDIVFRDPLHEIQGLNVLIEYMENMYGNVRSCEFVYLDEWVKDGSACIKWDMVFSHKRLAFGRKITVRGMTHISFNQRIESHEDVFDLGAMIYQNIPVLGKLVRWLNSRLSH